MSEQETYQYLVHPALIDSWIPQMYDHIDQLEAENAEARRLLERWVKFWGPSEDFKLANDTRDFLGE